MAEPQPDTIHEGADLEDETPAPLPKSAEDRKAAAALSSISARDDDSVQPAKEVDQEALGKAMRSLDVAGGSKAKEAGAGEKDKKKSNVKIEQADVALLVEELDLSRPKATDLLKAHDGDAVKAIEAFVTASA